MLFDMVCYLRRVWAVDECQPWDEYFGVQLEYLEGLLYAPFSRGVAGTSYGITLWIG